MVRRTSPGDVFWLSALAKLGATVVTYPLLLVKARLMSSGKHTSEERRYTGTLDALKRIWKTEGARPGWLTGAVAVRRVMSDRIGAKRVAAQ